MHVPPAGWIFGGQSATPPPLAFPVSSPHLLMLEAGAFHCLLGPLPPLPLSPGGISSAVCLLVLVFGGWAASHHYLQLSVWLTVFAACRHQRAHVVDECSPPDTVILRAETIPLCFASLNEHKEQFLGKHRHLFRRAVLSFLVRHILRICMTLCRSKLIDHVTCRILRSAERLPLLKSDRHHPGGAA